MSLLEVSELSTVYHGKRGTVSAVQDVSFSVERGEVLGVVGESGCGKTTLAMSVLRLIRPPGKIVHGRVLFEGEDIFQRPRATLRPLRGVRLALVPQAAMAALDPVFTARSLVAEILTAHQDISRSVARTRAEEMLRSVGISASQVNSYPHELSGGMRQRVAIAMALVNEPTLVVADEPATGLDVIVQAQILELLSDLRERLGLSMIFISHDLPLVAHFADSLLVMYAGRVVEHGSAEAVCTNPIHPYTRRLLDAFPRVDGHRRDLGSIPGDTSDSATGADPVLLPAALPDAVADLGRAKIGIGAPRHEPARCLPPLPMRHPLDLEGGAQTAECCPGDAPLLRLDDVRKSFAARGPRGGSRRTIPAVDGVSLEVRPGQAFGIIGESGSGKSTLARLILGLTRPDSGRIFFDGLELARLPERRLRPVRRSMHLIFQDPYDSLSARMRVRELVAEPLVIQREPRDRHERVLAALEEVDLTPAQQFADRFAHELSGGQRQRVALARALVLRPRLIIADEPTSMLDVSLRAGLLQTMRALRDKHHTTFVFITHDLALAGYFCDQIAVMFRGKVVEIGPAGAILTAPQHPYTSALMQAVRDFRPPGAGAAKAMGPDARACRYRDRCLLAQGICSEEPPLVEHASGHQVACHVSQQRYRALEEKRT